MKYNISQIKEGAKTPFAMSMMLECYKVNCLGDFIKRAFENLLATYEGDLDATNGTIELE